MAWLIRIALVLVTQNQIYAGGDNKGLGIPQPESQRELSRVAPPPMLVSPQPFSKIQNREVELVWNPVSEADAYHVQVATDPNFKWIIDENHQVRESKYQLKGIPEGTIYWRVFSLRSENVSGSWKSIANVSSFEVVP